MIKYWHILLFFLPAFCFAADQPEDASRLLLESLLRDGAPSSGASLPQQGMSVKIYQLANQRVDSENGIRMVDVLRKWLPQGSGVTPVPANNALHILTTSSAHDALADLLAALDQPVAGATTTVDPQ